MSNFIYVFSAEWKEALLALNYQLLKSNEEKSIFVFLNKEQQQFSSRDIPHALSDMLTF